MKKWLSTASSQVASTSTTIQPWSFCPKQTLGSPQCSGSASHAHVYTCHVCIHAMSSGDPWFSSQSSHSREGSLATTWAEAQLHRGAFSVVTPCHGLSVAPRGTSEETGHHRDTWGHKRFLHSNLSVHQNASFDRRWWFTYPCYSHVRCKKNCPCPVLAWLGTLCGFKQISKPTRLIPSHSSISRESTQSAFLWELNCKRDSLSNAG